MRCYLCQQVFRAAFPNEVATQPKGDISARAIVCLAKYQLGTPLYRLETWQKIMKLPVSDSEMWEWTESVALVLNPVHQALLNMAAKGDVIHNDDTTGKILELMEENRQIELAKNNSKQMEPNERLKFHQKHSASINDCERAIKSSVLIRRNSYFYKTCWGAFIGDTLLSIIKTCGLNGINPYDYLIAVQANSEKVKKMPNDWLPWNCTQNIGAPFVNVQHNPIEEIYRPSTADPPMPIKPEPQPCPEEKKKTLRERARNFFRHLYPEKWQEKLSREFHP